MGNVHVSIVLCIIVIDRFIFFLCYCYVDYKLLYNSNPLIIEYNLHLNLPGTAKTRILWVESTISTRPYAASQQSVDHIVEMMPLFRLKQ